MLFKALPVVCTQSSLPALPEEYTATIYPGSTLHCCYAIGAHRGCAKVMHKYNYPTECEELEFVRIWALGWEQIHTS